MSCRTVQEDFRFDGGAWRRLLLLCAAILFEGMSLSGINVQLAEIQRDLRLAPDQLQLVASAFLTTYAGFLLVGGRCADRWGSRRVFRLGVALFGAGSLGAALARDATQIIAARALQGAGAAITAPAAVALIVAGFPAGAARRRALGIFSAMGAVGFSLGVLAVGFITSDLGWRWAFVLYVPLCAAVIALAPRFLSADRDEGRGGVGWHHAFLVTAGLVALVYAIGRSGAAPASDVIAAGAAGLALVLLFLFIQSRTAEPLLPLPLLADRWIAAASIALAGAFAGITGAMFLVSTALQERHGCSPLSAGMAFLPQGLAVGVLSAPAARLAARWPLKRVLLAGLGGLVVGQLLYTGALGGAAAAHLLPAALMVGTGIAVLYPAATMMTAASARPHEQGVASGVLTTCQQAGGALGVAVVTAIQSGTPAADADAAGLWACAGFAAAALAACAGLLLGHPDKAR
ncbi:MFS transporter [Sorangium sp. So ce260]|uniref:MFS transporter n=1 Tax=Sorangium sp. So ce260 TaxID=3133291 RepID=UPI003F5DF78B